MSVKQMLTRQVDTALRTESVWEIAQRMLQHGVGAIVVVDPDRQVVGIVTDRDLVERVIAKGLNPNSTTVDQVMTRSPVTVHPDSPLEAVVTRMKQGSFRRCPVVDDQGELVGILTMDDIVMWLSQQFEMIGRLVERETPRALARS